MKRLFQFLHKFLTATKLAMAEDMTTSLNFIWCFLNFFSFHYLIQMSTNSFRLNFQLHDPLLSQYLDKDSQTVMSNVETLIDYSESYLLIQSISSWILIVSILCDFSFIGQFNFVFDLIEHALLDFFFFILMFTKVNIYLDDTLNN